MLPQQLSTLKIQLSGSLTLGWVFIFSKKKTLQFLLQVIPFQIDHRHETNFKCKSKKCDYYQFYSENLLRKIITVTNISFTFDFFFAQFVDVLNPVMAIDILVEKLNSEMSGPNMWHFIFVLKSILFDRGEKADEILHTEQMRIKQMREMKMDLIKSLINYKIN
jgi:hypothetical protein